MGSHFTFSNPSGRTLVSKILADCLPEHIIPHDDQLTCVCQLLDGVNIVAILATNAGKTGIFYMFILTVLAIRSNPALCPAAYTRYPDNAAMIIILPTVGLSEEMSENMEALGLSSIVITANSISHARMHNQPSPWSLAVSQAAMIVMSPEQLSSDAFNHLLDMAEFNTRLLALGVDEIHLIDTWGRDFRKAFKNIGAVRARLPKRVVLAAVTGTLLAVGGQTERVCHDLGLRKGHFFMLRRSNLRHDLQLQFVTLTHGLGGSTFPDFDFIVHDTERRKCIFFCPTIKLAFTLFAYFWSIAPTFPPRDKRFLLYTAANWPSHNEAIRKQMREDGDFQVLVATDAASVGLTIPGIADVHLVGIEKQTVNKLLQELGRANRDYSVRDARGRVYLPPRAVEAAKKAVADAASHTSRKNLTRKQEGALMELELAQFILATCKTAEQNRLYDNPPPTSCTCRRCIAKPPPAPRERCNCSGPNCMPLPAPPKRPTVRTTITKKDRLTPIERALADQALIDFRWSLWDCLPETSPYLPDIFISDKEKDNLLDEWVHLRDRESLAARATSPELAPHLASLLAVIISLKDDFAFRRAVWLPVHDTLLGRTKSVPDRLEAISSAARKAVESARKAATSRHEIFVTCDTVSLPCGTIPAAHVYAGVLRRTASFSASDQPSVTAVESSETARPGEETLGKEQLGSLPRGELQALARSHRVKANTRSAAIIEALCEQFPDGVPYSSSPSTPHSNKRTLADPDVASTFSRSRKVAKLA
ncbi:unnamed protein product [Peniophora sp. CBMAI 1063]|nr:unnamed protein product [Peniophora sp. CBMAI 1063]